MFKVNYDALGIAASVACAIHCALLPLFLTSLPILGINIINNTGFELMMIAIALVVGIYSLRHGFKKHHHNKLPVIIFASGMVLLILKQVLHAKQIWFLIPAVILIVTAHYLNYRDCRKDGECNSDNCKH